jgi:PAS domain-containing protein
MGSVCVGPAPVEATVSASGTARGTGSRRVQDPPDLLAFDLCNRDDAFVDDLVSKSCMFVLTNPALPDHPIIYASALFCAFFQYDTADVVGKNCRFLQCTQTDPEDVAKIRMAVAQHTPSLIQVLNQKKDGTLLWNHLYLRPLYNRSAQPVLYVGVQTFLKNADRKTVFQQRPPDEILWEEFVDKVPHECGC